MQRFYNESKEVALQAVKSSSQGLTQAEARARLERNGKNQLAQGKKDSLLKRFFPFCWPPPPSAAHWRSMKTRALPT